MAMCCANKTLLVSEAVIQQHLWVPTTTLSSSSVNNATIRQCRKQKVIVDKQTKTTEASGVLSRTYSLLVVLVVVGVLAESTYTGKRCDVFLTLRRVSDEIELDPPSIQPTHFPNRRSVGRLQEDDHFLDY